MPDDDKKERSIEKLRRTKDSLDLAVIMRILKNEKKPGTPKGTNPLENWTIQASQSSTND